MSVLKSKRGQSSMEFVETARVLEVKVLHLCIRSPKRLTFFLTTEVMHLASEVHNEVRAANNTYPRNKHEAQLRRDHLTVGNNALMNLVPKLAFSMTLCFWMKSAANGAITLFPKLQTLSRKRRT